ncbi:MAG: hypothetical protein K8F91_03340 [Candidatus Obscuribacterales bacterium]|nr:hypothetical protein [Candidatus Obscuribacterales bacterium]
MHIWGASGLTILSPLSFIAARCAPQAMKVTSSPACAKHATNSTCSHDCNLHLILLVLAEKRLTTLSIKDGVLFKRLEQNSKQAIRLKL